MDERNEKLNEMRKRGWSMHSEHSVQTAQSEQDLTEAQKKQLLENFPQHHADDDEEGPSRKKVKVVKEDEEEVIAVDITTSTDDEASKTTSKTTSKQNSSTVSPALLEHAKTKLSKWAARLFDPNRHRGLVEAPQIIPLNDEFLKAFGKRERNFDVKLGRTIVIDRNEILGHVDDDDDDETTSSSKAGNVANDFGTLKGRKVKVSNLGYTTTETALKAACLKFGPLVIAKMLMDKTNANKNIGRAYVTFELADDAEACIQGLTRLEGRSLTLNMADALPPRSKAGGGSGGPSRYWERDISTKCFRCGQVGHMSAQCPNPFKTKPCPLCGKDDHDVRDCHYNRICFRCGLPGHINRECRQPQVPGGKRLICGICFGSGHHRIQCRRGPFDAPNVAQAKCMVCGEEGHFMCKEMKWFFGLEGISCFNCGRAGHHGYDCDRPPLTVCARDEGVVRMELERAAAIELSDELESQKQRGRQRDRGRDDRNTYRPSSKSQPPPQKRGYNNGGGGGGSGQNSNTNRGYQQNNNQNNRGGGGNRGNNGRGYSASPGERGGSVQRRNDNRGYGNR